MKNLYFLNVPTNYKDSSIIEKSLHWLKSAEGENQIYSWIIFTIIGGGILSLLFGLLKILYNFINYRVFQAQQISAYLGEYYLYHPPLISGINDLPRVAKFVLTSNWLNPTKAQQFSIEPFKRIFWGHFEIYKSVLSFYLNKPSHDCPKTIILWHFQKRNCSNDRIAFGTMCCINYKGEPYHSPIIVSESRLPKANVIASFDLMMNTTITTDLRRLLMLQLNDCGIGDPSEEFEHVINVQGPIGNVVFKQSILKKMSGKFKNL